jgi:threonine dehydrogenase-like Zn-dependent dehydrogenase
MFRYPINFKGLVLFKKKNIKVTDIVFKGPLKKGQVLVKVLYSGICGKQIEEYVSKMVFLLISLLHVICSPP